MSAEQKPLIEEPKATGPGKDPETCGTCRYQGWELPPESGGGAKVCCVEPARIGDMGGYIHPPAHDHWPGCRYYVHREIRRDR